MPARAFHIRKKVYLGVKIKTMETFLERFVGLIGEDNNSGAYFETSWGVHTFFMKQAIDVIVLDNHWIVRSLKENLRPYRFYFWNPKFFKVIELPGESVRREGIIIGDKLRLEFC